MMARETTKRILPPIPAPPHDPTWWRLDARAGWRAARLDGVERTPVDDALALSPLPESLRALSEESGSFGGLTLPARAALAPDGSLYLLDPVSLRLKRFDSCACRFDVVPRFGGEGSAPRQLQHPGGIAIRGTNLYVCDTGNHRVTVLALPEMVLRAHWAPPGSAGLPAEWQPVGVAFDRRGRAYVTDRANGLVHRFSPSGFWERAFPGFDGATHIAVDRKDRIYVVLPSARTVRIVDTFGQPVDVPPRVEALRDAFEPLPFEVDAAGRLYLTGLCSDPPAVRKGASLAFDAEGTATTVETNGGTRYRQEGCYVTTALDSALYRCQWHRIVLHGSVPPGTSLTVSTYTAHGHQPDQHVLHLPDGVWDTNRTVRELDRAEWDGLIRSGEGRYLWLRLQFRGNGRATPVIDNIKVEYPRISLRRFLPAVFGENPVSADFTDRFLSLFDTILRSVERHIDGQAHLFDPDSTPATKDPATGLDFLSWLASWIGVTLDLRWPEARRRSFLKQAGSLFALRGTREGLWRQLLFYLGIEPEAACCPDDRPKKRCRPVPRGCAKPDREPCAWEPPPLILEHFKLRRWLFLGAGRLGDQAELWGRSIVNRSQLDENAQVEGTRLVTTQDPLRDPFHVYAHKFSVFVPAAFKRSDRRRKGLETLIRDEMPAHTKEQLVFVEPRFRIGFQSMIGLDAVVGRYPDGVTLGATPLGQDSVLGGAEGAPSLRVGKEARIGTTTTLD